MSALLDRGREWVDVYPEVTYTDSRGNEGLKRPSDTPVRMRASVSEDRGSIAEVTGQVEVPALRFLARHAPVGSYSRVVYASYDWDIATPPRQTQGPSRATRHTEFTVRGRNRAAYSIWGEDDPFRELFKELNPNG